jgi:putative ATP-dependent endonuclease of OLD family
MRLRELTIRNFRKIESLTVSFPKGLCVIVGENNTGKTAIVDALRLMLMPGRDIDALRLNEEDFRIGSEFAPIEITCTFCDASEAEEVDCHECLVDVGNGNFEVRLTARVEYNKTTRRTNVKMWGGETEGGTLPSNFYDRIAAIYLQPLRDPESGLRPGRNSQVARLVDCLTPEKDRQDFEAIATTANEAIRALQPVKNAQKDINSQITGIAGLELAQTANLVFSDPSFYRIIAGLQPLIDNLPFTLNGLGYNNLVFIAATLSTLRESKAYAFRTILIEEPEAHLHPQLQVLLLSYLASATSVEEAPVQVIVTSHSPILASQAPIDSVISVHEDKGLVSSVSVCSIAFSPELKTSRELKCKLQRYLDATRAELFFARRILIVEGIAEALLIPVLTGLAGGSLKKSAVTVVNADGLNFNSFLPLFGQGKLGMPVGVLTDGDSKNGKVSDTAKGLKAQEAAIPNLRVEYCEVTFEHELARSTELLPHMLNALSILHPQVAKALTAVIGQLDTNDEKATAFYDQFKASKVSKGSFAQEMALQLESSGLGKQAVPQYILDVLSFLHVFPDGGADGPKGSTT